MGIEKEYSISRRDEFSGQDFFNVTPLWLNSIISECGEIPNKYSFDSAIQRIENLKQYGKIPIDSKRNLFKLLFVDKSLAAGVFIVSMDLEFRGIQTGGLSLCMSEKFKDFLNFMLSIAKRWEWTNNERLSPVNMNYSRKLGINASPQYELRISIKGLRDIYSLAGPLANSHKDKCIEFHVNRSKNYINLGYGLMKNKSKEKILRALENSKSLTTTDLQFVTGTRVDVVSDHLKKLEKDGKVKRERIGKRYIWSIA